MMNINDVIKRLFDGLNKNENDWILARNFLLQYQASNQLSIKELDDMCFEDSVWVFEQIYGI